jgi:hypothetical protein
VAYLSLLRRTAATDLDPLARQLAYSGIMSMLGPESLGDLRLGAKDPHEAVRARVVVDSYNLLELNRPDRIWPPASNALISDVRAFLTEMQADPAKLVSINAKSMLSAIAQRQR